jgi:hypothetical protein
MNPTLAQSTTGIAGTSATFFLMEVNPWLAFVSGVLTIVLTSIAIYQKLRK